MNRTALFLGLAAVLSLLALVVGLPDFSQGPGPTVTPPMPLTPPPVAVSGEGSLTLQARLSHPYLGPGQSDQFLTLEVTGKELPGATRSPVNLALVLDRSGSMSGQKLADAKQAARVLVGQLRDEDRLAIVHYGSDVRAFSSAQATAANRERMLRYVDGIFDDGGTNIGDGLSAGRDQLLSGLKEFRVNRVILISDGQPTEGLTDHSDLVNIVRQIRTHGISVSSIGVGTDFNEDLMQAFSEVGAGSYAYLQDSLRLSNIFQRDLQAATTQVARNVILNLDLPEGTSLGEVLGYSSTQVGNQIQISLPDFSSGQLERVVVRLVVRAGRVGQAVDVAKLALGYRDLLKDAPAEALAQLTAMVTDRQEEITLHQDKDATVYATRARSARNTHEAAESLKRGDRQRAVELLQQNQVLFREAASVAGAPAVAADVKEQAEMIQGMGSANTEEEIQHQVKGTKRKAMKDYGRVGSTY